MLQYCILINQIYAHIQDGKNHWAFKEIIINL